MGLAYSALCSNMMVGERKKWKLESFLTRRFDVALLTGIEAA